MTLGPLLTSPGHERQPRIRARRPGEGFGARTLSPSMSRPLLTSPGHERQPRTPARRSGEGFGARTLSPHPGLWTLSPSMSRPLLTSPGHERQPRTSASRPGFGAHFFGQSQSPYSKISSGSWPLMRKAISICDRWCASWAMQYAKNFTVVSNRPARSDSSIF